MSQPKEIIMIQNFMLTLMT